MRGGWRVCREHLHHSGWPVMSVSRRCFVPGPMEVFTSPTGLLSLLYGRTSNTSSSSSSKEEPHEPRRGRVRTRSSRVVPPPPPRSKYFTKEAVGLALLVFCVSAAWELINSQRGMMTEKLRETFMTTLEVRSSQEEFAMIVDWMGRQPRGQRVRNVTLRPVTIMDEDHIFFGEGGSRSSSSSSSCTPDDVEGQRAALVPGYGSHMFRFQGTWMWVIRSEDQSKQRGSSAQRIDRENDVLTLRFLSRRRDVVSDFLSGVRESWSMHVSNRVPIYMSYAYGQRWRLLTERTRRPLSTLYLPDSVMEVVEEMRSFLTMRATYAELGIPWRRGYLFEGPPGTGKTSLAVAVAGELHLPLHLLSLRSESMDDETLLSVVSSLPPRCLLLVEDVENVMTQPSSSSSNGTNNEDRRPGISVSALLNALDGVASSEGRILIMTTNDSTKLPSPEALLRPGRVDRRVQFRPMANEEGQRMQDSFANLHQHTHVPEHMIKKCLEATGAAPSTPAVMQQCLLEGILAASRVTSS